MKGYRDSFADVNQIMWNDAHWSSNMQSIGSEDKPWYVLKFYYILFSHYLFSIISIFSIRNTICIILAPATLGYIYLYVCMYVYNSYRTAL